MIGYGYTISEDAIVVVITGNIYTVPTSAPHARAVRQGIMDGVDAAALEALCSPANAVKVYSSGRVKVIDSIVTVDGAPVPKCIEQKIVALMRDGLPFEHLVKFLERLQANPSNRAVEELYNFLQHEGLPITDHGTFLAYKGVRDDMFSCTGNLKTRVLQGVVDGTGRIYNGVGETIEVERKDVDDNCNITCSHGLHAGSHEYASGFGNVTVLVEIDPADVVSIPTDYDGQKARVCKYSVVSTCAGLMCDSMVAANNPYAALAPQVDDDEDELMFTQADLDAAYADGQDDGRASGREDMRDAALGALTGLDGGAIL